MIIRITNNEQFNILLDLAKQYKEEKNPYKEPFEVYRDTMYRWRSKGVDFCLVIDGAYTIGYIIFAKVNGYGSLELSENFMENNIRVMDLYISKEARSRNTFVELFKYVKNTYPEYNFLYGETLVDSGTFLRGVAYTGKINGYCFMRIKDLL